MLNNFSRKATLAVWLTAFTLPVSIATAQSAPPKPPPAAPAVVTGTNPPPPPIILIVLLSAIASA